MIIPARGVDKSIGIQLNKIQRTSGPGTVAGTSRRDALSISGFSALVERARAQALAVPDVRADRVAAAKSRLDSGTAPAVTDIASSMINRAVEGQV
jgi:hypothetical protein